MARIVRITTLGLLVGGGEHAQAAVMTRIIDRDSTQQAPPIPAGRVHRAWWVTAGAAAAVLTAGAFTTVSGLLVAPLHREFGWPRGTIGIAVSVNMVLYGLAAPFGAALADRCGLRRVAGWALALLAGGAALTALASQVWQLVVGWGLLVGSGAGALSMAFAATVAGRWFVRRRGLATGVLTAATVLGQFAFLPVVSWIVDEQGHRTALTVLAVAAVAVVPVVWALLRDHPADAGVAPLGAREFVPGPEPVPGAARRSVGVLLHAARARPFWLLAGVFAVCGASTNGVMWSHFTPAAHDHGMPATTASSLLALVGAFNVAGTVGSGWFTDRFDARRLLVVFFVLRGASLTLLPLLLAEDVHGSLVAFVVVFGLLDVATVPPVIALCREHYGAGAAVVFGWVNVAHQLGAGALALLGGAMRDVLGSYDVMWVGTGALCAVAALFPMALRRAGGGR